MPRDADVGRELARLVMQSNAGRINSVEFTYDVYLQLDEMDPVKSFCKIAPNLYSEERLSRGAGNWIANIQLVVTLVSAIGSTDDPQWVDDWLGSWDELIRRIREQKVLESRPISIDRQDRYDTEMFYNHKRLVTQAEVNFKNIIE